MKKIYSFLSAIIHPSAKGVYGRTFDFPEGVTPIGRADSELAIPAINSSMFMFNITSLLLSMVPNPAAAIGMKILDKIVGQKIIPFFEEAEKRQKKE